MNRLSVTFKVGDEVRLVYAESVKGRIVGHVKRSDRADYWIVQYWAGDKRETIDCDIEELEVL